MEFNYKCWILLPRQCLLMLLSLAASLGQKLETSVTYGRLDCGESTLAAPTEAPLLSTLSAGVVDCGRVCKRQASCAFFTYETGNQQCALFRDPDNACATLGAQTLAFRKTSLDLELVTEGMNRSMAALECESRGQHLLTIDSSAKMQLVRDYLLNAGEGFSTADSSVASVWLGAYYQATGWEWDLTGEKLADTFNNFFSPPMLFMPPPPAMKCCMMQVDDYTFAQWWYRDCSATTISFFCEDNGN